jgi:hypothetical protein
MHTTLQLIALDGKTEGRRRQGYSQTMRAFVAGMLVSLAVVSTAAASAPSLSLTPSSVRRGHTVLMKGSADGCTVGNTVFILSRAFVHTHDFAGVPAVLAKVKAGGLYRVSTRIPATKKPGRYAVTARCGGGNLGFLKHLTVRR